MLIFAHSYTGQLPVNNGISLDKEALLYLCSILGYTTSFKRMFGMAHRVLSAVYLLTLQSSALRSEQSFDLGLSL